jgi:enoyl-[acyl-carrier protein] reductase II
MRTRITSLFNIDLPIVQAGMVWASGHKLVTACSQAGILGLIGAGSMKEELLREHIRKTRAATSRSFGVNIPLLRKDADALVRASLDEGVRIFFTSAGNPAVFTGLLKDNGACVVHVVANVKQAVKAEASGCDAVVAEGFEAGGHNGVDEITTMCLIPQVVNAVSVPVIAAGGIADGRGVLAALALGADGVQIGTRFAASEESSAHEVFKRLIIDAGDTDTVLAFRKLAPTRLIKTPFAQRAIEAEQKGMTREELQELLGAKREMAGMFNGDVDEGEFEAGQISGMVKKQESVSGIIRSIVQDMDEAAARLASLGLSGQKGGQPGR